MASTMSAGWGDVQGLIVEGRLTDFYPHSSRLHAVAFLLSGTTQVEWKRGGRFTRYRSEPGSLTIVPAGDDHQFRTDRPIRALLWMIDPAWLQSVADQEWESHGSRIEIGEAFNRRDAEFWSLGQQLAVRLLSPIPGSRLYAEALQMQLALQLLWNHSSLPRPNGKGMERLADPRLRRVVAYIDSSLGNEISLGELAELAGLSPNYFLSAFRRATGKTPHRYLIERRVARACELLRNPHRSIVDVSLAVGFSSQSHLTTVFRRFLKTTPAAYREEVLGARGLAGARRSGVLT
ncbi:MAG TPA: AraC family transcriptional regulator [Isosphaeraceae bacterium]|nr:AraC family transcriptional regulator [Isosphaeraceae bacterium]